MDDDAAAGAVFRCIDSRWKKAENDGEQLLVLVLLALDALRLLPCNESLPGCDLSSVCLRNTNCFLDKTVAAPGRLELVPMLVMLLMVRLLALSALPAFVSVA